MLRRLVQRIYTILQNRLGLAIGRTGVVTNEGYVRSDGELPDGYAAYLVGGDELIAAAEKHPEILPSSVPATERAARGDLVYVVEYEGQAVCYSWYCFGRAPLSEDFDCTFDPAWAFGLSAHTLPEHRGKRLVLRAADTAFDQGMTAFTGVTDIYNHPMHANLDRQGMQWIGHVILLHKPFHFSYVTRPARKIGIGVERSR